MISYVVTEKLHFYDPEMQYLDIEPNTVCGIFQTGEEAIRFVKERIRCPLYQPFADIFMRVGNKFIAKDPGYVECVFDVHTHTFS